MRQVSRLDELKFWADEMRRQASEFLTVIESRSRVEFFQQLANESISMLLKQSTEQPK